MVKQDDHQRQSRVGRDVKQKKHRPRVLLITTGIAVVTVSVIGGLVYTNFGRDVGIMQLSKKVQPVYTTLEDHDATSLAAKKDFNKHYREILANDDLKKDTWSVSDNVLQRMKSDIMSIRESDRAAYQKQYSALTALTDIQNGYLKLFKISKSNAKQTFDDNHDLTTVTATPVAVTSFVGLANDRLTMLGKSNGKTAFVARYESRLSKLADDAQRAQAVMGIANKYYNKSDKSTVVVSDNLLQNDYDRINDAYRKLTFKWTQLKYVGMILDRSLNPVVNNTKSTQLQSALSDLATYTAQRDSALHDLDVAKSALANANADAQQRVANSIAQAKQQAQVAKQQEQATKQKTKDVTDKANDVENQQPTQSTDDDTQQAQSSSQSVRSSSDSTSSSSDDTTKASSSN